MKSSTINKKEIEKFSKMASEWWNPLGKFKPLHKFNPIRIKYIRDSAAKHFKIKSNNEVPLGHKIALQDFKIGDTIIKYGHDIGKVVASIKKGDHVHVHNVKTKKW